jgi:hypothetical protein
LIRRPFALSDLPFFLFALATFKRIGSFIRRCLMRRSAMTTKTWVRNNRPGWMLASLICPSGKS